MKSAEGFFPKFVVQFILPEAVVKNSPCSSSLSALLGSCPFHFSHFGGRVFVRHSGFVCIALLTDQLEYLFVYLLAIWISSLEKFPSLPVC